MKTLLFLLTTILFIATSCEQSAKDPKQTIKSEPQTTANSTPLQGVTVPFDSFSLNAEHGDTMFHKTGSIVLFPPNAFVDRDGNILKGPIQIKYREFQSPLDFYLADIPMSYDSSGKMFQFESSGMCEILAYQNGKPVYVNPKSQPEIFLATSKPVNNTNLYYLDPSKRTWKYRGHALSSDLNQAKDENVGPSASFANDTGLTEPLKPEKANNQDPILKMVIDPSSIKELLVYDNLKFQLDPSEKKFNPKDLETEWNIVDLEKSKKKGVFKLSLKSTTKQITYSVRPVFEDEDYTKALKVFEKSNADYQRNLKMRTATEEVKKHKYLRDSLHNMLIAAKNKEIERLNALIVIRNKEIEKRNKENAEQIKAVSLYNSFAIDGFGIWNCDRITSQNAVSLIGVFKNKNGDTIALSNIAVIYKPLNGIWRFTDNNIRLTQGTENMIIGIYEGKFAYTAPEDFKNINLTSETKKQDFIMTIVKDKDNTYEFIKSVVLHY